MAIPLKVWNTTRYEKKLEEQERLLVEARLAALTSQINPHFLFNTLNSVSSLIRTNPDQARVMLVKLSKVLRRLLRKHENFSALRDELSFIEDYLAIEVVRFGDKLRFEKDVAEDTLDMLVPSMLLQPLVENSIKHGLSGKVEGGTHPHPRAAQSAPGCICAWRTMASASRKPAWRPCSNTASAWATSTSGCGCFSEAITECGSTAGPARARASASNRPN